MTSRRRHIVLYVPGLGDNNPTGQSFAVNLWRFYGVRSWTVALHWADQSETWEQKFNRLLVVIDEKLAEGHSVSLVGTSAGAGAVINAFAARKGRISGVVTICGKIHNPETIGDGYRRENPAFVESANEVPTALAGLGSGERRRILSIYSLADEIVPKRDSIIEGAANYQVWTPGHAITIATQLILGAPLFLKFLKNRAK